MLCAQPGQLYNAEDGRKALRDVFALGLFDNVQIFPKPNPKDESKVGSAAATAPQNTPARLLLSRPCSTPPAPCLQLLGGVRK